MRACLSALVVSVRLGFGVAGLAAETLPPPPEAYFNDYAGLVSASDAQRLDVKLRRFAEETSTQVVVAIYPSLPSPSLEDFTVRAAQEWRVGRQDWDNGAVFFVFVGDRKMRIETGYGLEGALPDQLAARILDEQVRPRFRAGDWVGGLEAGIDGILAATRGEYKAPPKPKPQPSIVPILIIVVVLLVLLSLARTSQRAQLGRTYGSRGWSRRGGYWGGGWGGGSSWGGGGWSGGGGGGFSGGGGSFGGGGASSSW